MVIMSKQKTLRLILGDQLDELHSWFQTPDANVTYIFLRSIAIRLEKKFNGTRKFFARSHQALFIPVPC
jgi:hypothetical protein